MGLGKTSSSSGLTLEGEKRMMQKESLVWRGDWPEFLILGETEKSLMLILMRVTSIWGGERVAPNETSCYFCLPISRRSLPTLAS